MHIESMTHQFFTGELLVFKKEIMIVDLFSKELNKFQIIT